MAEVVYILCAVTSIACAGLLFRGFFRSQARLLLWSGLCFTGLFLNNAMLYIDRVVFPQHDLTIYRSLAALAGLALLLYGLIWDAE